MMDNPEEDSLNLHEDEEIIEVIDLNDTEQTAGVCVFITECLHCVCVCVLGLTYTVRTKCLHEEYREQTY